MAKSLITFALSGSASSRILICLLLMVLIGAVNVLVGPHLGLSIFYLLPILLATSRTGLMGGSIFSVLSALIWLAGDIHGEVPTFTPLAHYWNAGVRFGFFIIIVLLMTAWERERSSARKDVLTGIGNRSAFMEAANQEIERSRRYGTPVTVAYFDCDDFKRINDTLGHRAGDKVLTTVAQALASQIRKPDVLARMGGDEFALLLPETNLEFARSALPRMCQALKDSVKAAGFEMTFSIGSITFERPPESIEEMVQRADQLLYVAKNRGKNGIEFDVLRPSLVARAGEEASTPKRS